MSEQVLAPNELALLIKELRNREGLTQQGLAVRLDRAVRSVARWESEGIVGQRGLQQLHQFAIERGHSDLANQFFREAFSNLASYKPKPTAGDEMFWEFALRALFLCKAWPEAEQSCQRVVSEIGDGLKSAASEMATELGDRKAVEKQYPVLVGLLKEIQHRQEGNKNSHARR